MKYLLAGALTASLVGVPPIPAQALGAVAEPDASRIRGPVVTPGTCIGKGLARKPDHIRLICVRDRHKGGVRLRWKKWSRKKAIAVGRDSFSVKCTGCVAVTWKARFVLSRPVTSRGRRIFTRMTIRAVQPIPRAVRRFDVDRVERYHAKWRDTEGTGPCVYQWVMEEYAHDGPFCTG